MNCMYTRMYSDSSIIQVLQNHIAFILIVVEVDNILSSVSSFKRCRSSAGTDVAQSRELRSTFGFGFLPVHYSSWPYLWRGKMIHFSDIISQWHPDNRDALIHECSGTTFSIRHETIPWWHVLQYDAAYHTHASQQWKTEFLKKHLMNEQLESLSGSGRWPASLRQRHAALIGNVSPLLTAYPHRNIPTEMTSWSVMRWKHSCSSGRHCVTDSFTITVLRAISPQAKWDVHLWTSYIAF